MRGGTDKVRYFLSLGTAYQGGIMRGDDKTKVKQYNIRSNIDVSVTSNFEVGLDISAREKQNELPQSGPGGDIGAFASTSPLQEAYIGGDYRIEGTIQRVTVTQNNYGLYIVGTSNESWLRKFGQRHGWISCLTAASFLAANQESR